MKKLMALVMTAAIALTCTACSISIDMNKIKGEWTISAIGGQSLEEYAAANTLDISQAAVNVTVSDNDVVFTGSDSTVTCDIEPKSNGFEVKYDSNTVLTVVYDDSAETLSFDLMIDDNTIKYVLVKGTTSLETAPADGDEDIPDEEYSESKDAEE